jgi:hypothetical protein
MSNPIDRGRSISKLPPEKRARREGERESNHVLHKNALPSLNGWSVQVIHTHTHTLYILKALNHDNVAHKKYTARDIYSEIMLIQFIVIL